MMDLPEWLSLTVRWLHFVFGAAWIGTSFYFVWLNNHIREEEGQPSEVAGGLWSVHGGAFYRVIKYRVAPEKLPKVLHWFKWEAYLTWITGIALLLLVYYLQAELFMVGPDARLSPMQSVGVGVTAIVGTWVIYHFACKSPLGAHPPVFAALGAVFVAGLAWGMGEVLGPRAAYMHVGAALGTVMAANVFFVIIPNQRVMVDAMLAGKEPDGRFGAEGAQRSLHNNYLTLPVLFVMISNHFPFTYGQPQAWVILMALFVCGFLARHYFNLHGRGVSAPLLLPAAAAGMLALAFVASPRPVVETPEATATFADAHGVITRRCILCHASVPGHPAFSAAPKGFIFDRPEDIKRAAAKIYETTALTRVMPLANLTGITPEERGIIASWFEAGAEIPPAPEPKAPKTEKIPPQTKVAAGKRQGPAWEVYTGRCALCHGDNGAGDGPASASLNPRPRAFNDPEWLSSVDDEHIATAITKGGPAVGKNALMPPNPDLAEKPEVLKELVKIIRGFGAPH
jgi:uncharacterized membrane protein